MTRALSVAFGLLMVAASTLGADTAALTVAALAAGAVVASVPVRPAASAAVLLTVLTLVLTQPSAVVAALTGLTAAAYLVLRHTGTVTAPTVVGAVGLTAVALTAAAVPARLPWLPLAAPVAVLGLFVLAMLPFWRGAPLKS